MHSLQCEISTISTYGAPVTTVSNKHHFIPFLHRKKALVSVLGQEQKLTAQRIAQPALLHFHIMELQKGLSVLGWQVFHDLPNKEIQLYIRSQAGLGQKATIYATERNWEEGGWGDFNRSKLKPLSLLKLTNGQHNFLENRNKIFPHTCDFMAFSEFLWLSLKPVENWVYNGKSDGHLASVLMKGAAVIVQSGHGKIPCWKLTNIPLGFQT